MVKDVTISARISEELSEQLTSLAQALGRNRSWVIEEALRGYIASEQQFLTAVEEGLRDLEAGNVLDHDEVMAEMDERRQRLMAGSPR
ncbi:MAG: ribbon-helix-helix protein, CopG family [Thermomicrobiales bacterium]